MFKKLLPLFWVVFTDSLGWGIAFSVFAALFFSNHSTLLPSTLSSTERYMAYEFLLGIYSVFMFFFAPVLGGIADHYGRKPALSISMLGLTLGFVLSALGCFWSNLWFLVFGRIISGMTAGSLSVAQSAVVDMSTPETKPFYLSSLVLINCLGFSIGPLFGEVLTKHSVGPAGLTTFLIAAVMSILGFLGVSFFFEETYQSNPLKNKDLDFLKNFLNIKIAFANKKISLYLYSFSFSMIAYGLLLSNIPVFLNRQFSAYTGWTGSILSGFVVVLSVSLMLGSKYIFRYFSKISVVLMAQLIQLVVYVLISWIFNSLIINCFLFAIIAFTIGLMYIGLVTLISDATENDWQGRIMGVIASLFSLTWGIGPMLAGELNTFTVSTPFLCSALLVSLGSARFWFLNRKQQMAQT